jgi:hypothetical protein
MNEKLGSLPPATTPEKDSSNGKFLIKQNLKFLEDQMIQSGASENLLNQWGKTIENIDSGKGKKTLPFLEKLEFKKQENVEAWRRALYLIDSNPVDTPSELDQEEFDDLFEKEFSTPDIFTKIDTQKASEEEKEQIIESAIRKLYWHRKFLKQEIASAQENPKDKKQQKQLKEDQADLDNTVSDIKIYRKLRNQLYRKEYFSETKKDVER